MVSFHSSIIQDLLRQHSDISRFTFVLPSKRAGAFLRKEISHQIEQPVFSPEVISIEEFSEKISGLSTLDNTSTLFEFYSVYKELTPQDQIEDFEKFTTWAQTLIHDFNEIDRYLISSKTIFNYLSEIQDINHWSATPNKTDLVKNYLAFWKNLPEYYSGLQTKLLDAQVGYQGMVYRRASENIESFSKENAANYIFLGFNALNKAEQLIVQNMLENGARIFWDIDEVHLNDKEHDVSLFIREYAEKWPYYQNHDLELISTDFNTPKNIEVIGIPKSIGQAKYVGEILSNIDPEALSSTALVLGDESLLLPVLNSLPENLPAINITMGYPLGYSPFASLFEMVFQIFKYEEPQYYYKDVITVLSNAIMENLSGKISGEVISSIKEKNLLYLSNHQIATLFNGENKKVIDYLFPEDKVKPLSALSKLQGLIAVFKDYLSTNRDSLNMEFLYHYQQVIDQLQSLLEKFPHIKTINSLHHFFKEISSTRSLDFQGKPFQGLQLMGMLESRVLDFETVILTSVDEGTLPAGKSNNSFIPYELKKIFNLPTFKEKDAVYTYHFYHLLQRAKKVYLLHNTDNESHMGGEKSRFLLQLEIEKQVRHNIKSLIVTPEVPKIAAGLQKVGKTPEILQKIKELAEKGFSPSALTTYIRNPLDFYKQYILNIKDREEVEETVAYNTLGTVVHDTLEAFYSPLQGQVLKEDHIKAFRSRIGNEVKAQFEKSYSEVPLSKGKNLLIFEVAQRYVLNFIKLEREELKKGNEIIIRQIEKNLSQSLEIEELDFPVNIRGKVDRIDTFNGTLRIIDYKTGKVKQNQLEITNWEDLTTDYDKSSKPFQVLIYAAMFLANNPSDQKVEAGVISFKNLKEGFLKFGTKNHSRDKNKNCFIGEATLDSFKEQLKNLILEICDPKIPFIEKEIKSGYGSF